MRRGEGAAAAAAPEATVSPGAVIT